MTLTRLRRSRFGAVTVVVTLLNYLAMLLYAVPASAAPSDAVTGVDIGTGGSPSLAGPGPGVNAPESLGSVSTDTGAARSSYPFQLPTARGDAQPSLALSYDSSAGLGFAGMGWTLGVSSIVRKGRAGMPRFNDAVVNETASQMATDYGTDDYYADGKLLIPIGMSTTNSTSLPTAVPPALGWAPFRAEVDDGARYFFNAKTWVKQLKNGHLIQYGYPLDGGLNPGAELGTGSVISSNGNQIYRWSIVRDTDAVGNTVYYSYDDESALFATGYASHGFGIQYLVDIYDTSTSAPSTTLTAAMPATTTFAHHTHLTWGKGQYLPGVIPSSTATPGYAYSPIWKALPYAALARVDVTSASWSATSGSARDLVRSYQLTYVWNDTVTREYLNQIALTGDCMASGDGGPLVESNGLVSAQSIATCANNTKYPATTYQYWGLSNSTTPPTPPTPPFTLAKLAAYGPTAGGTFLPEPGRFLADLDGDAIAELVTSNFGFGAYTVNTATGPSPDPRPQCSFLCNNASTDQILLQFLNLFSQTVSLALDLSSGNWIQAGLGAYQLYQTASAGIQGGTCTGCDVAGPITQGTSSDTANYPWQATATTPFTNNNGVASKFQTVTIDDSLWMYSVLGDWTSSGTVNILDLMAITGYWAPPSQIASFNPVLGFNPTPLALDANGNPIPGEARFPISVGHFTNFTSAFGQSVQLTPSSLPAADITNLTTLNATPLGLGIPTTTTPPLGVVDAINPSTVVDVDGDGLPDVALIGSVTKDPSGAPFGNYTPVFSNRDRQGVTHPFANVSPGICSATSYDPKQFDPWATACASGKTFQFVGGEGLCCSANATSCVAPKSCAGGWINQTGTAARAEGACCLPGPHGTPSCENTVPVSDAKRTFADIDGDGLADLVVFNKGGGAAGQNVPPFTHLDLETMVDRGTGEYGIPTTSGIGCPASPGALISLTGANYGGGLATVTSSSASQSDSLGTTSYSTKSSAVQFGDFNGDGFADYAVLDPSGLNVCLRYGAAWENAKYHCVKDTTLTGTDQSTGGNQASILAGDVDGSGVTQLLYLPPTTSTNVNESGPNGQLISVPTVQLPGVIPGGTTAAIQSYAIKVHTPDSDVVPVGNARIEYREGLLKSVSNGMGATTNFTAYDTVAHLNLEGATNGPLPVPAWVVTATTTTNTAAVNGKTLAATGQTVSIGTGYKYDTPLYDPRDRALLGFRSVTVTNADTVVKTTFATDGCGRTGSCNNPVVDYSIYHATRGLPAVVETSSNTVPSVRLSTKEISYSLQTPYSEPFPTTTDRRYGVSFSEIDETTYLWDENNQTAPPPINFLPTTLATTQPVGPAQSTTTSVAATLPPSPAQALKKSTLFDLNGNVTSKIDFGRTLSPALDQPIQVADVWKPPPAPDPSNGWSFRKKTEFTGYGTGTLSSGQAGVREFDYVYDSFGQLTETDAPIIRPAGATLISNPAVVANRPAPYPCGSNDGCTATTAAPARLKVLVRDAYGNVTQQGDQTNLNTVSFTYDAAFHTFPQHMIVTSPQGAIDTMYSYDRGLGQPTTQLTTPAMQMTQWRYDDYGRLLELDAPSPGAAGMMQTQTTVKYDDAGPIRHVHTEVADGLALNSGGAPIPATTVKHDVYLDGFGETRASIEQISSVITEGTQLLLSDAHTSNPADGRLATLYVPIAWSGTLPTFGSGILPTQVPPTTGAPFTTYVTDSFGRPLGGTDVNGFSWAMTPHNALLTEDTQDQEQTTGGGHTASKTTIAKDGHGRTLSVTKWAASSAGLSIVSTYDSYLATGEPTSITNGGVSRAIAYDSLGRMATNTEANSGTWRYAYDYSGRLIGTSDARGCGQNIYYDSIGRLTARDFIPCAPPLPPNPVSVYLQPGYSPPDHDGTGYPTTGNGTEAFYTYNSSGQLADVKDLGRHDVYAYDPRGRLQTITRSIVAPPSYPANTDLGNGNYVGSTMLANRYASNVFTKTIGYDFQDRVLTSTTGATTAQITSMGNTETRTYSLDGRLQTLGLTGGTAIQKLLTGSDVTYTNGTSGITGVSVSNAYGDAAGTQANLGYGPDGHLRGYQLARLTSNPPWGVTVSPAAASTDGTQEGGYLINLAFKRDHVGNPTSINDTATAAWPVGASAVSQSFTYGNDYRLATATSCNAASCLPVTGGSNETFSPPTLPEQTAAYPNAFPNFETAGIATRFKTEGFSYDVRGNVTSSTDDLSVEWDRSLGSVTQGSIPQPVGTYAFGPDQVSTAKETPPAGTNSDGAPNYNAIQTVIPDAAGNITYIDLAMVGGASGFGGYYGYDELGRLDWAQAWQPEAFVYADDGTRVLSQHQLETGYRVYVFDSLTLYDATFSNGAYQLADASGNSVEQVNAGGGLARVFYDSANLLPKVANNRTHIFMTLGDGRGSGGVVVDHDSGEVVERMAYQPYGNLDIDYRPTRWNYNYERTKFGGHEDNLEAALVYMGGRYYSPQLGRFMSPDPLWIHGLQGDPNPYEYANGNPIRFTDPDGFDFTEAELQAAFEEGIAEGLDQIKGFAFDIDAGMWALYAGASGGGASVALGDSIEVQGLKGSLEAIKDPLTFVTGAIEKANKAAAVASVIGAIADGLPLAPELVPAGEPPASFTPSAQAPAKPAANLATNQSEGEPAINPQKQAAHIEGTPQNINRVSQGKPTSTFSDPAEADSLTREAWTNGSPLGKQGNLKIMEFNRPVGTGPRGGGFQTQVRVSMDADGVIHGTPYGPIFFGPLPP